MFSYECIVTDIETLRLPHVYRIHSLCEEVEIIVEMHDELMEVNRNDKITIEIGIDKEKCLEHEFCGRAHVVSVTKLDKKYRVVLSIGGLLVVLKNLSRKPRLEPVQELYIGISRKK